MILMILKLFLNFSVGYKNRAIKRQLLENTLVIKYFKFINFNTQDELRMSLHNDLPHPKFSPLELLVRINI